MSSSSMRFYWLDLLRFLAALTVLLVHARGAAFVEFGALATDQKTLLIAAAYAFTRIGQEAVIIFFVLSGFLVGGRAIEKIVRSSFRPLDYMIDRATRIMLPLIPALILTALVGLVLGKDFNLWHFIGNILSLQTIFVPNFGDNAPLWSLAYEVWFYVLTWSVGVAISSSKPNWISYIVFIVVCAVFTKLSSTYLYCWLIGAFAYVRRPELVSLGYPIVGAAMCLYGIIAIEIGLASVSLPVESFGIFVPSMDVSILLLASGISLIIQQIILFKPRNEFAVKLDSVGTSLAAFSYTLYLTHFPLLKLISYLGVDRASRINSASITIYLFTITACLIGGWIIYWLFEKRTLQVRSLIKTWIAD